MALRGSDKMKAVTAFPLASSRSEERRMPAAFVATLSFAVALAGLPAARAVAAEDGPAQRLFNQGVAAARENRWNEAREAFARAYGLSQHPVVLINLAAAEVRTGRLKEAASDYRRISAGRFGAGDGRLSPGRRRRAPGPRGPDPPHPVARHGPRRHGRRRDRRRDDLVGSPRGTASRRSRGARRRRQAIRRRAVPCFVLRRGRRVTRHLGVGAARPKGDDRARDTDRRGAGSGSHGHLVRSILGAAGAPLALEISLVVGGRGGAGRRGDGGDRLRRAQSRSGVRGKSVARHRRRALSL